MAGSRRYLHLFPIIWLFHNALKLLKTVNYKIFLFLHTGPFKADSMFASSESSLQVSLRAYLGAGVLQWLLKSDNLDESVSSLGLETIDIVVKDIFSADALTWFKNKFQLDVVQKTENALVPTLSKVDACRGNDDTSEKLALLCINDDSQIPQNEKNSSLENTAKPSTQLEELKRAIEEFVMAKETVPNPYLSYSHLSQYLNAAAKLEMLEKYSNLWKSVTVSI